MARLLLDTNVIVRFLTGDHPAHSPRSRSLLARAAAGDVTLIVTDLALAETVWVLHSFYNVDRRAIAAALKDLIESAGIEVQGKARVLSALRNFAQTDANFVDAYHAAKRRCRIHCHRSVRSRLRPIRGRQARRTENLACSHRGNFDILKQPPR